MSYAAVTTYQGLLQRMQALVTSTPAVAQPVAALPVTAPVMTADTFVRTSGFQMPATGSFLPGHFGPLVGALQTHLASLGYLAGAPDQNYANGTIEAVKYFQMDYGLPPNGLFDMVAYQTMMAVFAGQLPWKRASIATQPTVAVQPTTAQPTVPVQTNPLGLDWPSAPPQVPQQSPQNPLGVDWVTAPQPAVPQPTPTPAPKAEPAPQAKPSVEKAAADALAKLSPAQLTQLGATDKKGFFAALRPAAEESERKHGVPAAVTLAQVALETGWGKHIIPGYNIFGIKGKGPAGTVSKQTWEHYNGKDVTITANFAKYHNFYEAVFEHGKLFHNGYYNKAINAYKSNPDPFLFAQNITGVYATDPNYGKKLISIMKDYDLV